MKVLRRSAVHKLVLPKLFGTTTMLELSLAAGTHSADKVNIIAGSKAVIDPLARKATRLHNSPLNFIDLHLFEVNFSHL